MRGGCPLCVKVAGNLWSPLPSSDPTPDKIRVQILSPQGILRFWEWTTWEMRNLPNNSITLCLVQVHPPFRQMQKLARSKTFAALQQSKETSGPMSNSIKSGFEMERCTGMESTDQRSPGASRSATTGAHAHNVTTQLTSASPQYGQRCCGIVWSFSLQCVSTKGCETFVHIDAAALAARLRSLLNFAANWRWRPNEGCQVADWKNKVRVWRVQRSVQMWKGGVAAFGRKTIFKRL